MVHSSRRSPASRAVRAAAGLALLAGLAGCGGGGAHRQEVVVFAAASLTDALEALADSFEVAYADYEVVVNVAGTSVLARQIDEGARADVYLSASMEWIRFLEERGRIDGPARPLVGNRLVVVVPPEAGGPRSLEAVRRAGRVALADPEHVPAGLYAREALACAGLWEEVAPRVVPMLDVRAALLAVARAAADVGVVYASDLRTTDRVRRLLAVPERCQPDIRYGAAIPATAVHPDAGRLFVAFAAAPARASLWRAYGFVPPSQDSAGRVP